MPVGWRILEMLDRFSALTGLRVGMEELACCYDIRSHGSSRYGFRIKSRAQGLLAESLDKDMGWKNRFFYVKKSSPAGGDKMVSEWRKEVPKLAKLFHGLSDSLEIVKQVRALPENLQKFVPLSVVLSVEKLAIEQHEECSHRMSSVTRSQSGFAASELVANFKGKEKAEGSNLPPAPKLEVGDKVMVKKRRTQEVVDVEITVPNEDELEKKIVAATGLLASEVKMWKDKVESSFKAKMEAEENLKVAMDMLKKKNEEIEAKDSEWVVRMAESGRRHIKEMESLRNELMAEAAKPVFEARIEMIKEYHARKHTEWDLEEEYAALRKIAGEEVGEVNSKVQDAGKVEQVGETQEEKVDEGTGEE